MYLERELLELSRNTRKMLRCHLEEMTTLTIRVEVEKSETTRKGALLQTELTRRSMYREFF